MLWLSLLLLRAVPLSVVAVRRGQPAKDVPRSRLFVSMATMAAFDMGMLKFMPAYECLKAIHVRSEQQPNRR